MLLEQSSDVLGSVVRSLCESIDSPRSLSVWLCFKYNQDALLELPMADIAVSETGRFQLDYFVTEYLSKYKGLKLSSKKPSAVALEKWKLSELQCGRTNARFKEVGLRPFTGRVEGTLFRAQRKIAAVLGRLHLPLVLRDCKWGPGATLDMRREEATPDKKMTQAISVTIAGFPFLRAAMQSDPHWAASILGSFPEGLFSLTKDCFKFVRGSRFLTVAKSAKTDRCIAAEPTGNSFLQQGVHSYMRRRLKRFGIDLDNQSKNQKCAQDAYTSGLSTLDLSAASDTISRELVYHLLPLDWAFFLDSLRSPETRVGVEWVRTEKFASMGNAFCFELETLIFWALASSVPENLGGVHDVTVYGDDIIVHRSSFDSVVEILTVCGFTINEKKSFKDGFFYESCGKHYHKQVDVTPVYQKEKLSHPSEIIRAYNRLSRLQTRLPRDVTRGALRELRNSYPLRPFPRIPYGACEDGGFLRPLAEFQLDRNRGYKCHVLDYIPKYIRCREDAVYAYKLRRFANLNPKPTGEAANVAKGVWRSKIRWISESTVLEGDIAS